jgi:4,5-dihydroxyphthalate decarboxylase
MHIVVLRQDLARQEPWLPRALMGWFERAKDIATGYYEDPNWSLMPWGRHCFEDSRAIFGSDAWPSGVAANRANLERFVGYSMDQGLLSRPLPVESLFTDEVRST